MGLLYNVKQGQASRVPLQVLAANGAVTIASGIVHVTKATAAVITLADPPKSNDGAVLVFRFTDAAAHKIDNSSGSGFNGGGASLDVVTFTSAAGNGITLYAYNGIWHVVPGSNLNGTIGAT